MGSGKRTEKKNRKRRWLKRIVGTLTGLFLLGIIAVSTLFIVAYIRLEIPEPQKLAEAQTTTVYWSDEETLMGKFAEQNRTIVDISTLDNSYIADAVVSSEDRTFYQNVGIDFKGILRALWNNIQGKPRQGASTLTQQYVENYYTGKNTSYVGKFKESILALKISRQVDKEKILNDYLNTIYFGRGSYGIEAAAQAYFNKSANEVTLSEAALLAGIIPAPSSWDPANNPEKAQERWARVLEIMFEDGKITQEEKDQQTFPEVTDNKGETSYFKGTTGYLLQHVRQELINTVGYSADEIDVAGIKVYTTIDTTRQQQLEEAVNILPDSKPENLRTAAVSVDPSTGAVLAEYGGADYEKIQSNAVTQDRAQAGSTFKPFTLLAALEQGKTIEDKIDCNGPVYVNGTAVNNYGGVSYGTLTLENATKVSSNTGYVRLNDEIGGMEVSRQVAISAGYPKDTLGLDSDSIVGVLGTSSPHNIDIAQAYTTFATGGIRREVHIISKITDNNGNLIYQADTQGSREFEEEDIKQLTKALHAVASSGGTGQEAAKLGRPAAAKTGSSEDNKSAQFVGYIPQLVTSVSLYQVGPNGEEESITPFGGVSEVTGGTWPAKIWLSYMQKATQGMEVQQLLDSEEATDTASPQPKEKSTPWETATSPAPATAATRITELTIPSSSASSSQSPQNSSVPSSSASPSSRETRTEEEKDDS